MASDSRRRPAIVLAIRVLAFVVGVTVVAAPQACAGDYVTAARKAVAATVSPDLFNPNDEDISPIVAGFKANGLTEKQLFAAAKSEATIDSMIKCYDEEIGR